MKGVILAGGTGSRLYPTDAHHQQAPAAHLRPADDRVGDRGRRVELGSTRSCSSPAAPTPASSCACSATGTSTASTSSRTPTRRRPAASPRRSAWPSTSPAATRCSSCWPTTSSSAPSGPWSTRSGPTRSGPASSSRRWPSPSTCGTSACRCSSDADGRCRAAHRGEARAPGIRLLRHRHLLLRGRRLRHHRRPGALRPGRARDHRRQQPLRGQGPDGPRRAGGVLGRRRGVDRGVLRRQRLRPGRTGPTAPDRS